MARRGGRCAAGVASCRGSVAGDRQRVAGVSPAIASASRECRQHVAGDREAFEKTLHDAIEELVECRVVTRTTKGKLEVALRVDQLVLPFPQLPDR